MTEQKMKSLGFERVELHDEVFERTEGYPAAVYSLDLPHLSRTIETEIIEKGKEFRFTISDHEGDIIRRLEDINYSKVRVLISANNAIGRLKNTGYQCISKMN